MTDTPVPLRELAAAAVASAGRCDHPGAETCDPWWIADAVLAAVEPVIRQQVAEEISEACLTKRDRLRGVERMRGSNRWEGRQSGLEEAANIARSLSTQPEGITE